MLAWSIRIVVFLACLKRFNLLRKRPSVDAALGRQLASSACTGPFRASHNELYLMQFHPEKRLCREGARYSYHELKTRICPIVKTNLVIDLYALCIFVAIS